MHSDEEDAVGPSIGASALKSGVELSGGRMLQVDPEQVLAAAKIVSGQADALNTVLLQHSTWLRVDAPSENQVSVGVADAWNSSMVEADDSYLARTQAYVRGLRKLALQLRNAAEQYQLDDADAEAVFKDRSVT